MISGRKFVKTVDVRDLGVITCKLRGVFRTLSNILRIAFFANKVNGYERLTIFAKKAILEMFNEFVPNPPFLYPLKKTR